MEEKHCYITFEINSGIVQEIFCLKKETFYNCHYLLLLLLLLYH